MQVQLFGLVTGNPNHLDMSSHFDEAARNTFYVNFKGFASLADLIASDADHATAIFRRFDRLAARDLLFYQSELAELQAQQDEYDREDSEAIAEFSDEWHEVRRSAQDWSTFKRSADDDLDDGRYRKRMQLAMRIRTTLKQYSGKLSLLFARQGK